MLKSLDEFMHAQLMTVYSMGEHIYRLSSKVFMRPLCGTCSGGAIESDLQSHLP